jgi:hypothetical protein
VNCNYARQHGVRTGYVNSREPAKKPKPGMPSNPRDSPAPELNSRAPEAARGSSAVEFGRVSAPAIASGTAASGVQLWWRRQRSMGTPGWRSHNWAITVAGMCAVT